MRWVDSSSSNLVAAPPRRAGNVSVFMLLFMGLTVPTMFMMINVWRVAEGKVQQQRYCDAAALAAALQLTRETSAAPIHAMLLNGDPLEIVSLCQDFCIPEAQNYAAMNYVDGVALTLDTVPGAGDAKYKDVKFGVFDLNAAAPTFTLIDPTAATADVLRSINAVRIEAFRTTKRGNSIRLFGPAWTGKTDAQIVTRATAVLDRRVIGFRIQNNMATPPTPLAYQKIPLAPVVLLNDGGPNSWVQNVEAAADPSKSPIPYGTMTVYLPTSTFPFAPPLNAQLLDLGVASISEMATQFLDGVNAAQMNALGATGLLLDPTTFTVPVPSYSPLPAGDPASGGDFDLLYQALLTLKATNAKRAWALTTALPASGSNAIVSGFVAARIVDVQIRQHAGSSPTNFIQLTLQPTLLETPTAFTDYSNRFQKATNPPSPNAGPPSPYAAYGRIINPYLCRVRLVD